MYLSKLLRSRLPILLPLSLIVPDKYSYKILACIGGGVKIKNGVFFLFSYANRGSRAFNNCMIDKSKVSK
jgi:hypothetical protein